MKSADPAHPFWIGLVFCFTGMLIIVDIGEHSAKKGGAVVYFIH